MARQLEGRASGFPVFHAKSVSDTVGATPSIWISCVRTASALPALSNARYLTVVVELIVNGAE